MPENTPVRVSYVIVSYNVKEILQQCLDSLYAFDGEVGIEVVVVDNCSHDGTRDMLKEYQQHCPGQLVLVLSEENLGFSRGCNEGFSHCRGEFIVFLNPDTLLTQPVAAPLLAYLQSHPDVGAIGPKIFFGDGSVQRSCGEIPRLGGMLSDSLMLTRLSPRLFGRHRYATWDFNEMRDVGWISGCCLMIRRELFQQIHGFDENIFMYLDDTDLCHRVHQSGYRVEFLPTVTLRHLHGQSAKKAFTRALISSHSSRLYFLRKHYHAGQAFMLRLAICAFSVALSALLGVAALFAPRKFGPLACAHLQVALTILTFRIPTPPTVHVVDSHSQGRAQQGKVEISAPR